MIFSGTDQCFLFFLNQLLHLLLAGAPVAVPILYGEREAASWVLFRGKTKHSSN